MKKLLLAATLLAAMTATSYAATLQFIYGQDGGAGTTVNFPTASATLSNASTADFIIRSLNASTQPDLFGNQLLSGTSIDVSGTGGGPANSHTLNLTINALGLTGLSGLTAFLSSFDTAQLTSGWQVTAQTDINNVILSTQLFIGTGSSDLPSLFNVNSPFNASIHWDITNGGFVGGANVGTVLSSVPVPGPIVGAGIPGLMMALGGMFGLNWQRRRRKLA